MEHDSDLDFAIACLRLGQAKLRNERQRVLALEQLYAGTDCPRADALLRHIDRAADESTSNVRDSLLKQRIALERRFGSGEKKTVEQRAGIAERLRPVPLE